jgi:hypothetical protein
LNVPTGLIGCIILHRVLSRSLSHPNKDEIPVKAREWYERGQQAEAPIDALSNFWRSFNNLFFPVQGSSEREKIKSFITAKLSAGKAQEILDSHLPEIAYLLSKPVIDMRGNGKDTGPNILAFHNAVSAVEKLNELLMVIYQVRCNLEHGQKSPSRNRDNELCRCASDIVAHVVTICA